MPQSLSRLRTRQKPLAPRMMSTALQLKQPRTGESFVEIGLRVLAIILEMIIQVAKTHNEDERQQRIDYARDNPADYLRKFGRVRELGSAVTDNESGAMRGGKADD